MGMFRKKPIVIEARRSMEPILPGDIASWCGGTVRGFGGNNYWIEIQTLEGNMTASYGDWVIKGVKGEFYPCKNDIFEATYEEVKV